jgi:hypothetical protein
MSLPSVNGVLPPDPQTTPPPAAPGGPPSTNGGNGRDGRGRFTAGNRGGPGNPFARQTAALRRAFLAVVTPQHLEAIARMLVERARGGDLAAVKLLLLYVIGRPAEAADPDTLDVQEWQLFQQSQASAEQVQAALGGLALELACPMVRATRGPIADATAAQLAQALKTPAETTSVVTGQEVEDGAAERAGRRSLQSASAAHQAPADVPAGQPMDVHRLPGLHPKRNAVLERPGANHGEEPCHAGSSPSSCWPCTSPPCAATS